MSRVRREETELEEEEEVEVEEEEEEVAEGEEEEYAGGPPTVLPLPTVVPRTVAVALAAGSRRLRRCRREEVSPASGSSSGRRRGWRWLMRGVWERGLSIRVRGGGGGGGGARNPHSVSSP